QCLTIRQANDADSPLIGRESAQLLARRRVPDVNPRSPVSGHNRLAVRSKCQAFQWMARPVLGRADASNRTVWQDVAEDVHLRLWGIICRLGSVAAAMVFRRLRTRASGPYSRGFGVPQPRPPKCAARDQCHAKNARANPSRLG